MKYLEEYNTWLRDPYFDEGTRKELESIKENNKEINERFYKNLDFGTGGLRGILGAGTNRMNVYTVRRATQGLANYIIKQRGESKGVVIAYDPRRMSPQFALQSALCLAANNIKAYLFDSLRPTPELSFAVRELGCIAGIVITASHNPPEYNGYKVYWEDGAQITSPKDVEIISEVNAIKEFSQAKSMSGEEAIRKGLLRIIGEEIDNKYIDSLKKLVINPINEEGKNLNIVYSPLHGSGNVPARRILNELGFKNVFVVPEQEYPDSEFSTVGYPNPEDPSVYELARGLAKEVKADIILATDPDADRLGIQVRDNKGEYVLFNGNMTGALIAEYVFSQRSKKGLLPKNSALIKTIVSSNLADKIAAKYKATLIEVLTGFKYIGEQIRMFEETGHNEFVFGYEESNGYLIGTHSRDKDAIAAVMILCEAAAYYKAQGISLYEQMEEIYKKYGYYEEKTVSVTLKGIEGMEKIKSIMNEYRNNPPLTAGNYQILKYRDYMADTITDVKSGEVIPTGLPKADVLYYEMNDDAWCAIRPSGTEPKIKFYYGVKGDCREDALDRLNILCNDKVFLIEE